jgi:hydrogenase maturation protein HypF
VNGIVATGAELVNCFAIGKGRDAIISQHIGDLKNIETYSFYIESMELFQKLFRVTPQIMVCDAHPDYLSTRYAKESGLPVIEVQHHHAHIASCMAENKLKNKVIGIALDGTGYGDDGNIWGGEFMLAGLTDYQRYSHFEYVPVPGGDQAIKEPWRTALSYLYKVYGHELTTLNVPLLNHINSDQYQLIITAIDKNINCPLSSSAGRLFDAVSAITGICTHASFHADAPMRLEHVVEESISDAYSYGNRNDVISFDETIRGIVEDMDYGIPQGVISAKFHNTIIDVIVDKAVEMRDVSAVNEVVLSGGTFQNRYLLAHAENELIKNDFNVYAHRQVPMNDGGIALGQLAIAGHRIKQGY